MLKEMCPQNGQAAAMPAVWAGRGWLGGGGDTGAAPQPASSWPSGRSPCSNSWEEKKIPLKALRAMTE